MGVEMNVVTYFDNWGEWEAIETTVPMEIMGRTTPHTRWRSLKVTTTGKSIWTRRAVSILPVQGQSTQWELMWKH